MKKNIIAILMAVILLLLSPVSAQAQKIYGSEGELHAFTRETLTLYTDEYGSSTCGVVPRHKGMKVLDKSGSYCLVRFKKKGKTRTGWIAKEDFRDLCLKYDGSEINFVADGTYNLGGQDIQIENLGGNYCKISLAKDGKYFTAGGNGVLLLQEKNKKEKKDNKAQIWKMGRKDHHLIIQNKGTKEYLVRSGNLLALGTKSEACKNTWSLIRSESNLSPYRDFLQYDGRWGGKKYGDSSPICSGGCGVLALVNMMYALSGQFSDVMEAADFAVVNHYRVPDNGTDEDYAKAFVKTLGSEYGIKYTGKAPGVGSVKKCLEKGGVCVAHVPGHYVAIAAYNEKKDKYLVLDPHPLPKRGTSPYGCWVSRERLEIGYLNCYSSFKFERMTEPDFTWDISQQDNVVVKKAIVNIKMSKTEMIIRKLLGKGLK